jgi:hypothetical protein
MKKIDYTLFIFFIFLFCSACTSKVILIPPDENSPIVGSVQRSVGEASVSIIMPTGENLEGTLIWVEQGKGPVVGIANIDGKTATVMGSNVGGNAMYIGTLVGDKGTKLKMELICNSFTVKCTGVAVSNDGKTYNVILK